MLHTLHENHASNKITSSDSFQRDLLWFIHFLGPFNGVVAFKRLPVQYHVFVDATLSGIGDVWGKRVYTAQIPRHLQDRFYIIQYEMYNIVIALWTWGHLWQDKVVLVSCHNQSAISICETGKMKDILLNVCLHALWLHAARFNIELRVVHIPGKANEIADTLSRNTFQGQDYEYWKAITDDILHLCL